MVTTRSGKKTVPLQKKNFSGGSGFNQRLKEWYYLPKEQKNVFEGNRISEARIRELNKEYFKLCNNTESVISLEEWSEDNPVVFELNYGSSHPQVKYCFSKADLPAFHVRTPLNPFNKVPLTQEEKNELRRVRAEIQTAGGPSNASVARSEMTQEERMMTMAAHSRELAAEARFQREQEEWLRREQQQQQQQRNRREGSRSSSRSRTHNASTLAEGRSRDAESRTQDRSPTELELLEFGLTREEYDAAYAMDVAHQNGELRFQERPRRNTQAIPSIQPIPNRTQSRVIIDSNIPSRHLLSQREVAPDRRVRNTRPLTAVGREFYSINLAEIAREVEALKIVFLFGRHLEVNDSQNEFLRNLFSSQIDRPDTLENWNHFTMNFTLNEYKRDLNHAFNEMDSYIIERDIRTNYMRPDFYGDLKKLSDAFELYLRQMGWREGLRLQVFNFFEKLKPILRERYPDENFVALNLNRFRIEYLVKIFTRENIREGKIQKFS